MKFNCDEKKFEEVIFIFDGVEYPVKDFSYESVMKISQAGADAVAGDAKAMLNCLAEILTGMEKDIIKKVDARTINCFVEFLVDILSNPEKTLLKKKTPKAGE